MATHAGPIAAPSLDHPGQPSKWVIAFSVLFGPLMGAIGASVVNVALVHIQASYGISTQEVTWVSTSYLIALVIIMPLTAWLASVLGRKRMFLMALIIFTGASVLCGFSRTLGELIAFRVIQGVAAGAVQPTAQAIMRETFPLAEQAEAMGLFGMVVLLGPAIGPTLGGWLTDNFSWPWIFFVNLPVGVVGVLMAARFLVDPPYIRRQDIRRIDGVGIGLMALGLATLQTLLEEGETDGWLQSGFIVLLTIVSVLALVAFIIWELRTPEPAVNLRILGNLSFAAGNLIGGVLGLALYGSLILLPFFLQNLLGYDATQTGLTLLPRALTMLVFMPLVGGLYNRIGMHVMLAFGLVMCTIAAFLMAAFTIYTGPVQLLVPQIVQGIGFAFIFVPLSTATLSTIPRARMQSATGLYNLIRQLGGSVGTAIVIAVVNRKMTTASANLVKYASLSNPTFMQWWTAYQQAFVARGSNPTTAHWQALGFLAGLINQEASVVAFDYAFAMIGVVFLVCLPLVLLIRRGHVGAGAGPAVE